MAHHLPVFKSKADMIDSVLVNDRMSEIDKLATIFDVYKDDLKLSMPALYYAILGVLDKDKYSTKEKMTVREFSNFIIEDRQIKVRYMGEILRTLCVKDLLNSEFQSYTVVGVSIKSAKNPNTDNNDVIIIDITK